MKQRFMKLRTHHVCGGVGLTEVHRARWFPSGEAIQVYTLHDSTLHFLPRSSTLRQVALSPKPIVNVSLPLVLSV